MKIMVLIVLLLYALVMLVANLLTRRPGLGWLTSLNVVCALALTATSLAPILGWLTPASARLGLAGALLGLWVCALLNGQWLFGRIQPGHLLVRGGLSLVLWLAYTLV